MVFHDDFFGEMVHVRGMLRLLVTKAISADERSSAMLDDVEKNRKK